MSPCATKSSPTVRPVFSASRFATLNACRDTSAASSKNFCRCSSEINMSEVGRCCAMHSHTHATLSVYCPQRDVGKLAHRAHQRDGSVHEHHTNASMRPA